MRRSAFALVAGAALVLPSVAGAQDTQWNRYTLEDLAGVRVRAGSNDACESVGVSAASAAERVEAKLTEAEVPVLSEEQMLEAPGHPELVVSLECAEREETVGYSISLLVTQAAQMIRDPQVSLPEAVTWYATRVGVTGTDDADEVLEDALDAALAELTAAWTEANQADDPPSG